MPPWMAETYRRAREYEIAMGKVNAISGSTVTPAWVEAEVLHRTSTATVPVPGDGHADRYLRTMGPEEAAVSVLAAILAGDLPKRCTCERHQHRPDVREPDRCTVQGCGCEVRS